MCQNKIAQAINKLGLHDYEISIKGSVRKPVDFPVGDD